MKRKYSTIWYQSVDSTNSEARRTLPDIDNLSVIAARKQSQGRGQRGNSWDSEPGKNLTFTIVMKFGAAPLPPLAAGEQSAVSMAVATALVRYLERQGIKSKIKWPNDIYCGDRKICGILIENSVRDGLLSTSIIGVGLNLGQSIFPPEIPNPTSMTLLTGQSYAPEEELRRFLEYLDPQIELIFSTEGRSSLREEYLGRLYRLGEAHGFIRTDTSERFTGTIKGISDDARLIVEDAGGNVLKFAFKEIAYIV